MKDDRLYLIHMVECITRIEKYTSPGKEAFASDTMIQDAIMRNLHTLTESSQRLSEKLKETQSEVDWRALSGFRNVMVHDYLGINLTVVWDIIKNDLPGLKQKIELILQTLQ
jgi:uncharacterized protein with HEPN domain